MPAGGMTDTRVVGIAAVLTVLLAAATAWLGPRPQAAGGDGSSYSAGARGGKAAFETLKRLGHDIERSIEPLTAVRADPSRTVLVVTGAMATSELDQRAVREFIGNGGWVLAMGEPGRELLGLGEGGLSVDPLAAPTTHRVVAPSPISTGVSEITMVPVGGGPVFPAGYLPLVAVSQTEPLVTTARIGQGRVIWLAAVTPLSNAHIRAADNFQLLLNIVGPPGGRRILWDEHYHGYSRSLWSYTASTPLPWAFAQCGLLLIAVLATFSRRRLPVRPRLLDARTSPLEFIEMLRILYARAGGPESAVAAARNRFRRRVSGQAGLPLDAPDDRIVSAAAGRTGAPAEEIAELLEAARAPHGMDAGRALRVTARLQSLSNELDAPRRPAAGATSWRR